MKIAKCNFKIIKTIRVFNYNTKFELVSVMCYMNIYTVRYTLSLRVLSHHRKNIALKY